MYGIRFHDEKHDELPTCRRSSGIAVLVCAVLLPAAFMLAGMILVAGVPHGRPQGFAVAGSFPDYASIARALGGVLLFAIGWLLSFALALAGIIRAMVRRQLAGWAITAIVCTIAGIIAMMYFGSR